MMGDISHDHIKPENAFENVDIDFTEENIVKTSLRRNAPIIEAYICIFVCFARRVGRRFNYERFFSRLRIFTLYALLGGMCSTMYSDNGSKSTDPSIIFVKPTHGARA